MTAAATNIRRGMARPAGLKAKSWLGRAVDSVISEISPIRGARRMAARGTMAAVSGYEAARSDYSRRTGSLPGGGADRHQPDYTLRQLREMCHSHDRNGSVFSGMLDRARDNIVGSEFRWEAATSDKTLNRDIDAYVAEWARPQNCDGRGLDGLVDQCGLALRAIYTEGNQIWAMADDDRLHCYETDQLVGFRNPQTAREKQVVNGVELDGAGRPAGFWLAERKYGGWVADSSQAQRIDAADCLWLRNGKRRSQTLGIPALASGLTLYERFDAFLDNETFAAEINAMLAFFIEDDPASADIGNLPPGMSTETRDDATTRVLEKLERGQIVQVRRGSRVRPFSSERPGSNFGPYTQIVLSMVGASIGMPLILVLLDFSKVNCSSARAALLEARKSFRRWQHFIKQRMFTPVYTNLIARAVGRGVFPARSDVAEVTVRFPGWEWVDPLKEVQADTRAIAAGLKSFTEVCEARGRKFADVCDERQKDEATLTAAGITAILDTKSPAVVGEDEETGTPEPGTGNQEPGDAGDDE